MGDVVKTSNAAGKSYTLGITQFADMSRKEFSAYVKRSGIMEPKPESERNYGAPFEGVLAATIDWRDQGAVTPVKDQGQCGSCWSFSATGSMEGAYYIKNNRLVSFAEQQLVDCSTMNHGCNGGSMDLAFYYTQTAPLETEDDYPYEAAQGTCRYEASKGVASATGYEDVQQDSADALKGALNKRPVSVAIEADTQVFQFYQSGILDSSACGTNLDHGVLAVGYGANDEGEEYYIVKNSWNTVWGME